MNVCRQNVKKSYSFIKSQSPRGGRLSEHGSTRTQIALINIANGLYHYEIGFANMKQTVGKLNILK